VAVSEHVGERAEAAQPAPATERILMVAPYPPHRDGIAAYAVQEARRLLLEGHHVEVLSPGPSAAHHHLDLKGPRGGLALAKRVRGYDRLLVQFHPDLFYDVPSSAGAHAATSAALGLAFRLARSTEVRVHEVDYTLGRAPAPVGPAAGAMWKGVDRLVLHTEVERSAFLDAFRVDPTRVDVADHGGSFVRRTTLDRGAARRRLGIVEDAFVFLSIGFIQPHKGFDRAIEAFAALGAAPRARLDIVGSVRVEEPDYVTHLDRLQERAAATPGVTVHPGYVSDELFDVWLVAADLVVLPYRRIWSSGVLERAALFDRPVVATRVGGLADQAPPGTVLVDDDEALVAALRAAVDPGAAGPAPAAGRPWPSGPLDRERIQAEIRARGAAARRGVPRRDPGPVTARSVASAVEVSAPVRRLTPLVPPPPVSARPGASALKRVVRRLTAWQLDPIVAHVNALQRAVVAMTDALAAESGTQRGRPAADGKATDAAED
jgi:glycosyltransferase involved in cell wall biosynthesis